MKVLVGIDGSTYSDAALGYISERVWPSGTEILVLHAYELPLAATPEAWGLAPEYYIRLSEIAVTQADSIVQAALKKLVALSGATVKIEGQYVLGSPKRVILDEAESWKPDLIVVGSHGYPMWERLLLGSVSQAVVSHAKCSVEVVRIPHATAAA